MKLAALVGMESGAMELAIRVGIKPGFNAKGMKSYYSPYVV